jgi:hypothetical protein
LIESQSPVEPALATDWQTAVEAASWRSQINSKNDWIVNANPE